MLRTVSQRKHSRNRKQRSAMLQSLLMALLREGTVTTTEPRARDLKILADTMISAARKDDVASKRRWVSEVPNKELWKVAHDISATRTGGYVRSTPAGLRRGDNAPMRKVELLSETPKAAEKSTAKATDAPKKETDNKQEDKKTEAKPKAAKKETPTKSDNADANEQKAEEK